MEPIRLYYKVKIDGKWTWRKAEFLKPPLPFDLVYEVLPYREGGHQ